VRLSIIRDEAGFAALEPVWDALLARSSTHSPFQTWDYIRLWWAECRHEFQLCIGVVHDDEEQIAGIAPLCIGRGADGTRQHLRHLGFMNGMGEVQGERLDFLVPAGREGEITPVLITIVTESRHLWDVVRLNKVPTESLNYSYLLSELRWAGSGTGVLNLTECRFIKLPSTWDEYAIRQSGNWRRKMRKRWEQISEGRQMRTVMVGKDGSAVAPAIERFFELHAMHFPEGVSSFLRPRSLKIHRQLMTKWLLDGRASLCMVEADGVFIAGIYTLKSGDEVLQYQLGWDSQYARFGLGNLAMKWAVECAIQAGARCYDLLPGDYEYKLQWCNDRRLVSDVECFHPYRPSALVFRALRTLKRRFTPPKSAAAAAPVPATLAMSEE
jgi:CelD/BcsL family acetyltransferase involved in cellulose biosynthesis